MMTRLCRLVSIAGVLLIGQTFANDALDRNHGWNRKPGWYTGAGGQGCTATCAANGLVCSPQEFAKHNADVDSGTKMAEVVKKLGVQLSASCDSYFSTNPDVPVWSASACHHSAPNRAVATFNCGAQTHQTAHRLCYCTTTSTTMPTLVTPKQALATTERSLAKRPYGAMCHADRQCPGSNRPMCRVKCCSYLDNDTYMGCTSCNRHGQCVACTSDYILTKHGCTKRDGVTCPGCGDPYCYQEGYCGGGDCRSCRPGFEPNGCGSGGSSCKVSATMAAQSSTATPALPTKQSPTATPALPPKQSPTDRQQECGKFIPGGACHMAADGSKPYVTLGGHSTPSKCISLCYQHMIALEETRFCCYYSPDYPNECMIIVGGEYFYYGGDDLRSSQTCTQAALALASTSPTPKHPACKTDALLGVAGAHLTCASLGMFGIQDPCSCLCSFDESDIRQFTSCAIGAPGPLSAHEQWRVCKTSDPGCGDGGVVVVHGRHLRVE